MNGSTPGRFVVLVALLAASMVRAQPAMAGVMAGSSPPVDIWQQVPSTLVLDSGFRWESVDRVFTRLGWRPGGNGEECWEHVDRGRSIWIACPRLRLTVNHEGRERVSFLDHGKTRSVTIPAHLATGRLLFLNGAGDGSGGMFNSPNLAGFLLQAWWQESDSAAMAAGGRWVTPIPRSSAGLLGRLAVSARWATGYLEEDNPFILDRPMAKPLGHFFGWFVDVLAWGAVIGPQFQPGLRPGERAVLASVALGIGAGVRLGVGGWPMLAELDFRNAMARGPYRWPAVMVPESPGGE